MLELDRSENPWRTEIVEEPFRLHDGFVSVPTKPGLGIEVDEAVVKSYAVQSVYDRRNHENGFLR